MLYFPFYFITTKKLSYTTTTKYEVMNTSYYEYLYSCIHLLKCVEVENGSIVLSDTGEEIVSNFDPSDNDLGEVMKQAIDEMKNSFINSISSATVLHAPKGYSKGFLTAVDEYDCEQVVPCYVREKDGQKFIMGEFLVVEVIERDPNEPARKVPTSRNNKTHTKKLLRQWLPKWKTLAVFDRESIVE